MSKIVCNHIINTYPRKVTLWLYRIYSKYHRTRSLHGGTGAFLRKVFTSKSVLRHLLLCHPQKRADTWPEMELLTSPWELREWQHCCVRFLLRPGVTAVHLVELQQGCECRVEGKRARNRHSQRSGASERPSPEQESAGISWRNSTRPGKESWEGRGEGGRERGVESRSEIEVKVLEGGGETSGDK